MTFDNPSNSRSRGFQAEKRALEYLKMQGLRLIMQNYRCYYGEIDLIMCDKETLVFVEVRFRAAATHGSAVESVRVYKLRRVVRAAYHYLTRNSQHYRDRRIDVVGIEGDDRIEWIKNAFEVR